MYEHNNSLRQYKMLQVQQQIKKSSPVKRTLARLSFAIGTAYIRARRILDGVALEYARTAPSMFRVMLATFTAAVLYPLYRSVLRGHCLVPSWQHKVALLSILVSIPNS